MPTKDRIDKSEMLRVLDHMVYAIINAQRPGFSSENSPKFRDEGSFPFIPQTTTRLMYTFHSLRNQLSKIKGWSGNRKDFHNTKFLDAGCGIGNVMMLARTMGLASHCHGIEYFDETYRRAKQWLGIPWKNRNKNNFKLFRDDIMTFPKYGDYDIIYYYCPFSDSELQRRFEEYLEDEMKVGAILIAFLKQSSTIRRDNRFNRIRNIDAAEHVFIKRKKGTRKISNAVKDTDLIAGAANSRKRKLYIEKYKMDAQRY